MVNIKRKIIAIGGGEIAPPSETLLIDAEILHLTENKGASLLFIPTASNDSLSYFETVKQHFLSIGFSSVDVLNLLDTSLTRSQIEEIILSHHAIYVGGGNTLKMMTVWQKLGVDMALEKALNKGIVLSGISAGSICWFSQGISDSISTIDDSKNLCEVAGLGFIDAVHCPHYDSEPHRQAGIKTMMMNSSKVAICLENCVALEISGDKYRIVKSKATAKAYKVYWKDNEYYAEEIESSSSFRSLASLLAK